MIRPIRHILLDIEGTTCPVTFVSAVLFPYAAREVRAYLRQYGNTSDIKTLLAELKTSWRQETDPEALSLLEQNSLAIKEAAAKQQPETDALLPYIDWLIRRDRKVTAWKDLQGRIWSEGYARGELQADLFPEVAETLRQWKQMGFELSVYSSGSVAAQQLLYGHSGNGDLRRLFSHWFDTRIGAKQDVCSYQSILEVLDCTAAEVLFISDSSAELAAAAQAGLQVIFSDREGNPDRNANGFSKIEALDQLVLRLG